MKRYIHANSIMTSNYQGYAERYEGRYEELSEGQIITIGTHWSYEEANPECYTSGNIIYKFECRNFEGHKIDYEQLDEYSDDYDADYAAECEEIGINADCDDEKEVYAPTRQYRVTKIWEKELDEFSGDYFPQVVEVEML